jgi:AcrR family transcriptional regulator
MNLIESAKRAGSTKDKMTIARQQAAIPSDMDGRIDARMTGRQAEKSLHTQNAILEATIGCLVELGYTNTTMERIAQSAKVSRGAMMHHYTSRADVIDNAASYLADLRIVEFVQLARKIVPPVLGGVVTLLHFQKTTELNRQFYAIPSFTALQELLLAARTDRALTSVMRRAEKSIATRMAYQIATIFPYWDDLPATMEVLIDLYHFSLKGVAMSQSNHLGKEREAGLQQLLAQVGYDMYLAAQQAPPGTRK